MALRPGLNFVESLLLDLWEEVEDKTDIETQDVISDGVGWPALIGTLASLREKSDNAKEDS